jgi:hypothetical protein
VQRGHLNFSDCGSWLGLVGSGFNDLFDIAAKAAFTTCTVGGLMPQLRHGGMFVCVFAVAGSKLEGTGFAKVQIGQIQVAFALRTGAGATWRELSCRVGAGEGEYGELRMDNGDCLLALEYSVILGEDLRNPAYRCQKSHTLITPI